MSTALVKKCPQNVSELKQKRSREQGKLRAPLDRVNKKLDKAGDEGEVPRGCPSNSAVNNSLTNIKSSSSKKH